MPGTIILFVFTAVLGLFVALQWEAPVQQAKVETGFDHVQLDKYRVFVVTASDYMAANPGSTGTFYWTQIKSVAPATVANMAMPSDWKLVSDGSTFVTCTSITRGGVLGQLGHHVSGGTMTLNATPGGKVVLNTTNDAATNQTEANKCT